jgi:hypothetical protein
VTVAGLKVAEHPVDRFRPVRLAGCGIQPGRDIAYLSHWYLNQIRPGGRADVGGLFRWHLARDSQLKAHIQGPHAGSARRWEIQGRGVLARPGDSRGMPFA